MQYNETKIILRYLNLQVWSLSFLQVFSRNRIQRLISPSCIRAMDGVGVHLINALREIPPRQKCFSLPFFVLYIGLE